MGDADNSTLSVDVPDWMSEALKALARRRGITLPEMIRRLMLAHVEEHAPESVPRNADVSDAASPIVRMANAILVEAIRKHVTEIRLVPEASSLSVVHQARDSYEQVMTIPKHIQGLLFARYREMADAPKATNVPTRQEGTIPIVHEGKQHEVLASFEPKNGGEEVVTLRIVSLIGLR